jgi:hypothetical protein
MQSSVIIVRIYLQHAGMLYIDPSTYVLVIYGLLICSSSCYYSRPAPCDRLRAAPQRHRKFSHDATVCEKLVRAVTL